MKLMLLVFMSVNISFLVEGTFDGKFEDKDYAIAVFHWHNEEVKQHVPAEKLLVYNVKEGWEPLCAFLGVEVSGDTPFPGSMTVTTLWAETDRRIYRVPCIKM